jgi:hypothetical protein
MQRKLLEIISMDLEATGQILDLCSAFVKANKKTVGIQLIGESATCILQES